jgi:hypothetical protein
MVEPGLSVAWLERVDAEVMLLSFGPKLVFTLSTVTWLQRARVKKGKNSSGLFAGMYIYTHKY